MHMVVYLQPKITVSCESFDKDFPIPSSSHITLMTDQDYYFTVDRQRIQCEGAHVADIASIPQKINPHHTIYNYKIGAMARGNARRVRVNNQNDVRVQKKKAISNVESTQSLLKEIDDQWEVMPPQVRTFLLEKLDELGLHELAKFWSKPAMIEYTRGDFAASIGGASWFMAMRYLKMGMHPEARTLTLNGCFLHQCFVSMISCCW